MVKKFKSIFVKFVPKSIRQKIFSIIAIFKGRKIFILNKDSYNEDGLATNHITDFLKDEKRAPRIRRCKQKRDL